MKSKTTGYLRELWQSLKYTLRAIDEGWGGLVAPLAVALIAWSILQHDPFGLEKATNAASRRVVLRLLAASYRLPSADSPDRVSVLLIDDAYLRQVRESWPLPYAAQGAILRSLLSYKPKAVFIDILYRHAHAQRKGAEDDPPRALVDAVRPVPAASIIFADLPGAAARGRQAETYEDLERKDAEDLECSVARHATEADVSDEQTVNAIDHIVPYARQRGWNVKSAYVGWVRCNERYPLAIKKALDAPRDLPTYFTPASELYKAGCSTPEAACQVAFPVNGFPDPIVLRWGAIPSSLHVDTYGDDDDDNRDGHPYNDGAADVCQPPLGDRRFLQYGGLLLNQFARNFAKTAEDSHDPRLRLPCPSVDTLYVSELMAGRSERLEALLEDRYVIVGVRLDGIPDLVASPVNGLVPGAMFHAVALDNLLRYQGDYLRQLSEKGTRMVELLLLIPIVLLVAWMEIRHCFQTRVAIFCYGIFTTFVLVVVAIFGEARVAFSLAALMALSLLRPATATMFAFVLVLGLAVEWLLTLGSIAPGNWIGMLLATAAGVTVGGAVTRDRAK